MSSEDENVEINDLAAVKEYIKLRAETQMERMRLDAENDRAYSRNIAIAMVGIAGMYIVTLWFGSKITK